MFTDEELAKLIRAAEKFGNSGDVIEVDAFLRFCFEQSGKPMPEWTPDDQKEGGVNFEPTKCD